MLLWLLVLLTTLLIYKHLVFVQKPKSDDDITAPHVVRGLPILGNVVTLGQGGCNFISACCERHPDAFTLYLLSQKMTYLCASPLLLSFFKSKSLSFGPAVQTFTARVFGLPPAEFYDKHKVMLMTLREIVGQDTLQNHAESLHDRLNYYLDELAIWKENGPVDLFSAVSSLVFRSGVDALFGTRFLGRHGPHAVQEAFLTFESGFERAASPMPHALQPAFCTSKKWLLHAMRVSHAAGDFRDAPIGPLLTACDVQDQHIPNLLLCVLWASQANTVPATFWGLAFLLLDENKEYRDNVLNLIHQNNSDITGIACQTDTILAKCCAEAVRLCSHSIDVRIAIEDTILQGNRQLYISKGTVVAISPFDSHRNEELYGPDPREYNPQRPGWGKCHEGGVVGIGGILGLSFGGGFYRCPGRLFAEVEMSLVVGLLLKTYDVTLVGKGCLPELEMSRLVGIKLPKEKCFVKIRKK